MLNEVYFQGYIYINIDHEIIMYMNKINIVNFTREKTIFFIIFFGVFKSGQGVNEDERGLILGGENVVNEFKNIDPVFNSTNIII